MRERGHLTALAPEERMQGGRGGQHLPTKTHQQPMQGRASDRTRAKGANAKSAGGASICPHQRIGSSCKECGGASTSANGANAGVRGGERLPAPATKVPLQGVRAGFRRQ